MAVAAYRTLSPVTGNFFSIYFVMNQVKEEVRFIASCNIAG